MSTWPAHEAITRPWVTNPDARDSGGRRPPREDRLLDHVTASVPPAIAALTPDLSSSTVALVDQAAAAVTDLDTGAATALGALGGFLLRSESIATSKIERVDASLDEFARAMAGAVANRAAQQTAAAVHAITTFVDAAGRGPLTTSALLEAHRTLLRDDPYERTEAGRFRSVQNWVGGNDFTPRLAAYVPPPPDMVTPLVDDLLEFANRADLPALAQAAIAHAQFESIHPFTDGNGRVGRALLNAILRRRALTTRTVVPVAAALLADVDRYFAMLGVYRTGDVDAFVAYVADACISASAEAQTSGRALASLPGEWRTRVKVRRGSAAATLLDHLLDTPVLTEPVVARIAGVGAQRAYDALDKLTEGDVLTEVTGQRRNRVWVAHDVLDEIDRLEERIGRRRRPGAR